MKKTTFIIIDAVIALTVILGIYMYINKKNFSNQKKDSSANTVGCLPEESFDCTIKDAIVVSETLKQTWQKFPIEISKLPVDSWYKITTNTEQEFQMILYPNVGKHYLLGSHDFTITLKIAQGNRDQNIPLTCTKGTEFIKTDDLPGGVVHNGPYDIGLSIRVNYFYKGPSGGNPNPFTPQTLEILKNISNSIRIGKCS